MDVVYLVGGRSMWNRLELKYSLRSLKYFPHDKVWIVGDKPDWYTGYHIDYPDKTSNPYVNTHLKLLRAVNDKRISDPFLLFDDDMILLRNYKPVIYYAGQFWDFASRYEGLDKDWGGAVWRTFKNCPTELNYCHHSPHPVHKELYKGVSKIYPMNEGLVKRVVYLDKEWRYDKVQMHDVKIKESFKRNLTRLPLLSTGEYSERPIMWEQLNKLFPDKSVYEV